LVLFYKLSPGLFPIIKNTDLSVLTNQSCPEYLKKHLYRFHCKQITSTSNKLDPPLIYYKGKGIYQGMAVYFK